jgi:MoaA/NifB/PqqE/SkfB family radical SAM enzyme
MTSSVWLQTIRDVRRHRVPGQLVVQITDACNARCPQCGMRVTEKFPRSRLTIERLQSIIDAAAEKGFQAVSFTGGEPLLFLDDLIQLVQYAGKAGIPFIRTGTNGFIFMGSEKKGFTDRMERIAHALADTPLRNFWISIDSAIPEVHESMRGLPGVIEGIHKALPIFHACGIFPSANLGINRNLVGKPRDEEQPTDPEAVFWYYRSAFSQFYRFVSELGFTMVNCCYPMSIPDHESGSGLSPVYAATATAPVINFSPMEKIAIFQALSETIPSYRSRIRIFTPRTSLHALIRQLSGQSDKAYPCRGGIDFFFIDAQTGHAYPCGYRGQTDMGDFEKLDRFDPFHENWDCRECDWECFRDPSELMGPFLGMRRRPFQTIHRLLSDRIYSRLWLEDLRYYHACNFFDGRKAPDWKRLRYASV